MMRFSPNPKSFYSFHIFLGLCLHFSLRQGPPLNSSFIWSVNEQVFIDMIITENVHHYWMIFTCQALCCIHRESRADMVPVLMKHANIIFLILAANIRELFSWVNTWLQVAINTIKRSVQCYICVQKMTRDVGGNERELTTLSKN